jgi:serine/threonine-protein kinase PpkA
VLVVADDSERGNWLCHRLLAACHKAHVLVVDSIELRRQVGHPQRQDWDLVLAMLDCGGVEEPANSAGLQWLSRFAIRASTAPIAVIAESGNELAAVLALRLGAMDYLPADLVTTPRLSMLVEQARHAGTAVQPLPAATNPAPEEPPSPAAAPLLATPRRLLDGRRDLIPGYQLLLKLGESLRATVYLAASAALGRNVALKISRGDAEASGFAHEYTTLRALRSPAVIDIHEYGTHDGREYIAMEYFPCGDLRARLLNPISEQEALDYLRRIAGALAAVHRAGLRHGDLKPGNIMLRENAQVVLIDFGLTMAFSDPTQNTMAVMLRGSPYYMSPEHAQGAALDERSDLYSLGVIFHELLTGQKPYAGAHAIEVLHRHVEDPLPTLPEALMQHQSLLDRLLAKSPDARFRTAEEVLRAIAPREEH